MASSSVHIIVTLYIYIYINSVGGGQQWLHVPTLIWTPSDDDVISDQMSLCESSRVLSQVISSYTTCVRVRQTPTDTVCVCVVVEGVGVVVGVCHIVVL